jgi:hypothetical protein
VFGARLSVRQSLSLVMVALTVTAMLAVAFAPISLFFLITAPDYGFFKLLNVAILALSAMVGLKFLTGGMRVLNEHGLLAPEKKEEAVQVPVSPPVPALVPAGAAAEAPGAQPIPAQGPPPVPGPQARPFPPGTHHPYARPPMAPKPAAPPSMTLLYIWILLFGFVGTQLAWTLRPFFGSPDKPFSLYREIDGNFYAEIFRTIADLF